MERVQLRINLGSLGIEHCTNRLTQGSYRLQHCLLGLMPVLLGLISLPPSLQLRSGRTEPVSLRMQLLVMIPRICPTNKESNGVDSDSK